MSDNFICLESSLLLASVFMKRTILLVVFILASYYLGAQTHYYSAKSGNWAVPENWSLDADSYLPPRTSPAPKDHITIRDSIYHMAPRRYRHYGNVLIEKTGLYIINTGSNRSDPYVYAGDQFNVFGALRTSSDFHHQLVGSMGNGELFFQDNAQVEIGDDLILNAFGQTYMDNAVCGEGFAGDDIYFRGPGPRLCGSGTFLIIDEVKAQDANGKYTGTLADLSEQICDEFQVYADIETCIANGGLEPSTNKISLPIELLAFEAHLQGEAIMLHWQTASELENDFFTLEKSKDGVVFAPIASLPGAGTTLETQTYQYVDQDAWKGKNFYRLKQTDFSGAFSFSAIIEVVGTDVRTDVWTQSDQAGNMLLYGKGFENKQEISLTLYTLSGSAVGEQKLQSDDTGQFSFTLSDIQSAGLYFVSLDTGTNKMWLKLKY